MASYITTKANMAAMANSKLAAPYCIAVAVLRAHTVAEWELDYDKLVVASGQESVYVPLLITLYVAGRS